MDTGKESTCNAGDVGSIPGLGRSPGETHDNSLFFDILYLKLILLNPGIFISFCCYDKLSQNGLKQHKYIIFQF